MLSLWGKICCCSFIKISSNCNARTAARHTLVYIGMQFIKWSLFPHTFYIWWFKTFVATKKIRHLILHMLRCSSSNVFQVDGCAVLLLCVLVWLFIELIKALEIQRFCVWLFIFTAVTRYVVSTVSALLIALIHLFVEGHTPTCQLNAFRNQLW